MSGRPKGVYAKVAAVQRTIKPVELQGASGDDAFEFMAARDVFAEVDRKLKSYKLGFLPDAVSSEPGPPVRARVQVTLFDVDKPDDRVTLEWEGEADKDAKRPYGSARTNAIKAFWVALFQIPPAQKPPENRREARQQAVRAQPKLATWNQREHRILKPARERGISEDRVVVLANGLLPDGQSIGELKQLPESWVDPLRDVILKEPQP